MGIVRQCIKIGYFSAQCNEVGYTSAQCIKIGYISCQCIKIGYSSVQCIKMGYSSVQCIKIRYSSGHCNKIGNVLKWYRGWGSSQRGGSFANVGFTTGLTLPYLDIVFVGLHILLRVRINYYWCCRPLTLPYTEMT